MFLYYTPEEAPILKKKQTARLMKLKSGEVLSLHCDAPLPAQVTESTPSVEQQAIALKAARSSTRGAPA